MHIPAYLSLGEGVHGLLSYISNSTGSSPLGFNRDGVPSKAVGSQHALSGR
jgi:hypothetical protein